MRDTVSFHGAFIILLWRRENSGRQDWKNGQGSDHGRFLYHGMEDGIYPKSVLSPSLPTSCYKTGLGWGCTTSSWGPKWSLLMVMRNRMFNKATAFYVWEILVHGIFSSFFPSQAIMTMSENTSKNKPKLKQALAPLLHLTLERRM